MRARMRYTGGMRWVVALLIGGLVGAGAGEYWGRLQAGATYEATVTSEPPGAFVYVDGHLLKKPDGAPIETPVRLFHLPAARPSVLELRKPGFKTESRKISSSYTEVRWTLVPDPSFHPS